MLVGLPWPPSPSCALSLSPVVFRCVLRLTWANRTRGFWRVSVFHDGREVASGCGGCVAPPRHPVEDFGIFPDFCVRGLRHDGHGCRFDARSAVHRPAGVLVKVLVKTVTARVSANEREKTGRELPCFPNEPFQASRFKGLLIRRSWVRVPARSILHLVRSDLGSRAIWDRVEVVRRPIGGSPQPPISPLRRRIRWARRGRRV